MTQKWMMQGLFNLMFSQRNSRVCVLPSLEGVFVKVLI